MEKTKTITIIFAVSFIFFIISTILIGLGGLEPAKCSSEVPEYFHTDIENIGLLVTIVSFITMMSSLVLLHKNTKEVDEIEKKENQ